MADMRIRTNWASEANLVDHLSRQLIRGRLALVLGAGASTFYGLPDWDALIHELYAINGETLDPNANRLMAVSALRSTKYKGKPSGSFANDVSASLFKGVAIDFNKIRENKTLSAIGALVMASGRGSASTVVTFNFDDLLEIYLEYHGFVTNSVFKERHWAGSQDVTIYHPHGFVPLSPRPNKSGDDEIVLDTDSFLKIMNDPTKLWRPLLQTILRTHSFIYLGISGDDIHLQSLLQPLNGQHVIADERIAYHGVRLATVKPEEQGKIQTLDSWGLYTHAISSYDEIPDFLFKICQEAQRKRIASDQKL